jgi:hypothetical protein
MQLAVYNFYDSTEYYTNRFRIGTQKASTHKPSLIDSQELVLRHYDCPTNYFSIMKRIDSIVYLPQSKFLYMMSNFSDLS